MLGINLARGVDAYLTVARHGRGQNDTEHLLSLRTVHGAQAGRVLALMR
ncbi:hypothetical protein ACGF1Z_12485 [Streptomyces sp. NPDC048018]